MGQPGNIFRAICMSAAFRDNLNLLQSLCVARIGYLAPRLSEAENAEEYRGLPSFSPFSPFCAALRKDPARNARCEQCDRDHLRIALTQNEPHCYVCHAGCRESMIVMRGRDGTPMGVLIFGQLRTRKELPNPRLYARRNDAARLKRLYRKLPPMSAESARQWARVFAVVGRFIVDSALQEMRREGWARTAFDYIEANMDRPVSLPEVAAACGKSRSFLTHNFARRFGMPFRRYMNGRRIARAKELLVEGLPIKEVSTRMGFGDRYVFTRLFTKATGVSPGRFARKTMSPPVNVDATSR